ncbi:glucose-6-phosphate isomerase [Dietzia sp. B32]|uniref:glucose-6-phosphate isomerase n=1 Tax=Dietzia sp. B32 TaxID=2915130 RepID=UPI0021AD7797|nr:glucose-6-phosphate isomerase [Dietzia sp. B32]UVE96934.1 glucose-6-phosphate isomerase [Dietzia sp. B32]
MDRDISTTDEWRALEALAASTGETTLRRLFDRDPDRGTRLGVTAGDLYVDLSKNLVTDEVVTALLGLARVADLPGRRAAMFRGDRINTPEDRAVLHTALRRDADDTLTQDGRDVIVDVHETLRTMTAFAERVRSGEWTGYTGKRITTVLNIGIGGSDLGPAMVDRALRPLQTAGITAHYVSNVDPRDLDSTLAEIDPETTLVIVASKTFTTQETLANAHAARRWFLDRLGAEDAVAAHFVAVSTASDEVAAFGIAEEAVFGFWDWVGGRFSVGSAIGLSCMITLGPGVFTEFLEGMSTIDEHFATAADDRNAPLLMGLLGVWYTTFLGAQTKAVIPYAHDLARFPAYLQQLTMESLGKSARLDGSPVGYPTGEIYWGEPGTNGQHAFFQLLHQGTHLVPVDFIGLARPAGGIMAADDRASMHDLLVSNMFAQSRVLAFGRTDAELRADGTDATLTPHLVMPGNRPSTTILAPALTPGVLGQLIALYEHVVFVQGVIWNINAFDQWGVELGKKQARDLYPALAYDEPGGVDPGGVDPSGVDLDSSTAALIARYRTAHARDGSATRG